jgi:hypothetical protein
MHNKRHADELSPLYPRLVTNGYRKAISDVLPKHSLFPTSVLTIDKFRVVQDAYECLIKPESRAEVSERVSYVDDY